jgi:hypothetical protein
MDMEEVEIFKQSILLSNLLKQSIEHIAESINYLNQKDVINRILLFSTSKKFKFDDIEQEEEEEELFVPEVESVEEEEREEVDKEEDDEEEEEEREDDDEEEREEEGGFDYDIEYEEDEYQNTD